MSEHSNVGDQLPEFLTSDRIDMALKASWEAEGCARLAIELLSKIDVNCEAIYPLRALLIRLLNMSTITMGALGDEGDDAQEMRAQLTGIPGWRTE